MNFKLFILIKRIRFIIIIDKYIEYTRFKYLINTNKLIEFFWYTIFRFFKTIKTNLLH
jgi:hypothetical protein